MDSRETIMAVDPGSEKCGLAMVRGEEILVKEIVPRKHLVERIKTLMTEAGPIVIGGRTGSRAFIQELVDKIPEAAERIVTIDEHLSSVEARSLYWKYNPPRRWRRLLPVSLQTPPVPIDDYVAVILAHRYLSGK